MSNFSALKTAIQAAIKQNGNNEITGDILQDILLSIVSTLGDSAINTLEQGLQTESQTRGNDDAALSQAIEDEATARVNQDTQLGNLITGIKNNIDNGYVYAGIATPSTSPVSGKVFYIATQAGTYTNLGNTAVKPGMSILKYNGSAWSNEQVIYTDGGVFDVSAYNGGATYASLEALLSDANLLTIIPPAVRKGGMSIKFVSSVDNIYVQYRCIADNFTTDINYWEKQISPAAEINELKASVNSQLKLNLGYITDKYYYVNYRACSPLLYAPFKLSVNSNYQLYQIAKFTLDGSYIDSNMTPTTEILDTRYLYSLIFRKLGENYQVPMTEDEMNDIVDSFTGCIDFRLSELANDTTNIKFYPSDFESGNIVFTEGNFIYNNVYDRARTKQGISYKLKAGCIIENNSTSEITIGDIVTKSSLSGWIASNRTYTVLKDGYYVILTTKPYSDIEDVLSKINIYYPKTISQSVLDNKKEIALLEDKSKLPSAYDTDIRVYTDDFESGNIDFSNFTYNTAYSRTRTKQGRSYYLHKGTVVINNSFAGGVIFGNIDTKAESSGWINGGRTYTINSDGHYAILIGNEYSDSIVDMIADLGIQIYYPKSLSNTVCDISSALKRNGIKIPDTDHHYYGKKVVLKADDRLPFNIKLLLKEDNADVTYATQSMAIYNGLIVIGVPSPSLTFRLYNLSDLSTIQDIVVSGLWGTTHMNAMQFSNVFYDEDDEFPLLLVSSGDYTYTNRIDVFRITKDTNNNYVFTIVKKIVYDNNSLTHTYIASSCIDIRNNVLWMYAFNNATYSETWFYKFAIPNLTDGQDVTLGQSNVLGEIHFPYKVGLQDSCIINGKLFMGGETQGKFEGLETVMNNGYCVLVIDLEKGYIETLIPNDYWKCEPEGVAVYNNKLYVAEILNSSVYSGENNELRILEYSFD